MCLLKPKYADTWAVTKELRGRSDTHAVLLILLDQLSAWKLHSEDSQVSVKVKATDHVKDNGRYDMVQFLNAVAAKAVKKNWNIRTLVLELKDGDVIAHPDIKRFVTEQLLRRKEMDRGLGRVNTICAPH